MHFTHCCCHNYAIDCQNVSGYAVWRKKILFDTSALSLSLNVSLANTLSIRQSTYRNTTTLTQCRIHHFPFTSFFPDEAGRAPIFFPLLFRKGTFWDQWRGFLRTRCPSFQPASQPVARSIEENVRQNHEKHSSTRELKTMQRI